MSISEILAAAAADATTHLGDDVTINGVPLRAIVFDGEVETDSGPLEMIVISLKRSDLTGVTRGQVAIVKGEAYKIDRIPPGSEPLVNVELKRA